MIKRIIAAIIAALCTLTALPIVASAVTVPYTEEPDPNNDKLAVPGVYGGLCSNEEWSGNTVTITYKYDLGDTSIRLDIDFDYSKIYARKKGTKTWKEVTYSSIPAKPGDTWYLYRELADRRSDTLTVKVRLMQMLVDNVKTTALTKSFIYEVKDFEGSTVYYTTNGKKPTTKSKKLTEKGILIDKDCTLRLLIKKKGYANNYYYYQFTIDKSNAYAEKAKLLNKADTYNSYGVGLNRSYGAKGHLYYTTDGSIPTTKSEEIVYSTGYGKMITKTMNIHFLYVDTKGKQYMFAQRYVISDAGNATSSDFNGIGG